MVGVDSEVMAQNTTRALTLLTAVPATIGLVIGVGAGTAAADTANSPAPTAEQGVVHYDGIFDDLDDLHVPHHIRHHIDAAAGSLGVVVPWHLIDDIDDDWDDDHDDDWDD